jgi:hypothetical protein
VDVAARKLSGDDVNGIADKLTTWLEGKGRKVVYALTNGRGIRIHERGYTNRGGRKQGHQGGAGRHAAAWIRPRHPACDQYREHRGIAKTEAESVAYVAGKLAGLDMSATSIEYITGWKQSEPNALGTAAETVRKQRRNSSRRLASTPNSRCEAQQMPRFRRGITVC